MSAPTCPECAQGMCRHCAGWVLDESTDDFDACRCPECAAVRERGA